VENVVVERQGEVVGIASVRAKSMAVLGSGIAYIAGGPLVRDREHAESTEALQITLAALIEEFVARRGLILRIAPGVGDPAWMRAQEETFLAADLTPVKHLSPYTTKLVDIGRPLAEVRAGFASKWRRDLNRAEREGIEVGFGQDLELFEEFKGLFAELVERKSLSVDLGSDFYCGLQSELADDERFHIGIARVDGEPAAGVVASILGDTAVYLLGASNEVGRKSKAAYLLQWRAIEAATELGCSSYDLGGVNPDANPGVYRFKDRMGGVDLSAPTYEIAPGRIRHGAVRAGERLFRAAAKYRRR
jgi:lipid II:glycine glycyltransferase (peptidoglycan interpeptide bridge formation enzyme)